MGRELASGGRWPRYALAVGDAVYVANQYSDSVTCLSLDRSSEAGRVLGEVSVPAPSCLAQVEPGAWKA